MRTHCLSNLTTLVPESMLRCSGAAMPGSMKGLVSSPASMMVVVTDVEDMVDGGFTNAGKAKLKEMKMAVVNEEASNPSENTA